MLSAVMVEKAVEEPEVVMVAPAATEISPSTVTVEPVPTLRAEPSASSMPAAERSAWVPSVMLTPLPRLSASVLLKLKSLPEVRLLPSSMERWLTRTCEPVA